MKIKLASPIEKDSIVNGEGIRTVIWTQGCTHNCPGCHNPETHDFDKGFLEDVENIKEELSKIRYQDGITLSGGDPLYQIEAVSEIAKHAKEIKLNVWCYTGFTFEKLVERAKTEENLNNLLQNIDVMVDGRFEEKKKSLNLPFRGSENQRIIDVQESLKQNKVITIERFNVKQIYSIYSNIKNIASGIFI